MSEAQRKALEKFVECVDATDGVRKDRKGLYRPVGDPDWVDLGDAYVAACHALGREPLEKSADEDDDDELMDPDAFHCHQCGELARENSDGTTTHLTDEEEVDYERDADHVAHRDPS